LCQPYIPQRKWRPAATHETLPDKITFSAAGHAIGGNGEG
jgi:hypothetical protein